MLFDSVLLQVFDGLQDILRIHLAMKDTLNVCKTNWDADEKVAYAIIASLCNDTVRSVYKRFVDNFQPAMDAVNRKLQTNVKFKKLFADAESKIPGQLPFSGIIVKPVQRFPHYILFIQVS